jgi:hypothetical protein
MVRELFVRCFLEVEGKRYFVKEICGFQNSNVIVVRVPNDVENIAEKCSYQSKSLTEVTSESESNLKEIGYQAFPDFGLNHSIIYSLPFSQLSS